MLECPYPLTYGWNVDYMAAYGDPAQADEFNALVRFIKTHNMADVSNYLYVSGKIDIDGLIDFSAHRYTFAVPTGPATISRCGAIPTRTGEWTQNGTSALWIPTTASG